MKKKNNKLTFESADLTLDMRNSTRIRFVNSGGSGNEHEAKWLFISPFDG